MDFILEDVRINCSLEQRGWHSETGECGRQKCRSSVSGGESKEPQGNHLNSQNDLELTQVLE